MKKLMLTVLLLTGCETASQLGSMSRAGLNGVSCDQIYSAFTAYQQDRNSMDAWVQLVEVINPNVDARALTKNMNAAERYQQAVSYANLGLAVQGCQPL